MCTLYSKEDVFLDTWLSSDAETLSLLILTEWMRADWGRLSGDADRLTVTQEAKEIQGRSREVPFLRDVFFIGWHVWWSAPAFMVDWAAGKREGVGFGMSMSRLSYSHCWLSIHVMNILYLCGKWTHNTAWQIAFQENPSFCDFLFFRWNKIVWNVIVVCSK